ncbi:MAG: hypothetical protein RR280_01050 [Bacteroidaceae bacterium]
MQSIPRNKIDPKLVQQGGTVQAEVSNGEVTNMKPLPEITIQEIRKLLVYTDIIATKPAKATQNHLLALPALFQKLLADRTQGLITIEILVEGNPVTVTQEGDTFVYKLKDSK